MINYGRHLIDKNDIREVVKVLKSNFLTTGPKIKEFEDSVFTGQYNVGTVTKEFLNRLEKSRRDSNR